MGRKPVHLMCVESKNYGDGVDHNKFYDMMEVNGELHVRYGKFPGLKDYKFGETGVLKIYPLSDWDRLLSQKTSGSKRYTEEPIPGEVKVVIENEEDDYKPIDNKEIAKIVARLQLLAKNKVNANYETGAAGVTPEMIDKAQLCINNLLCCSDVFNFNRELERLFRCIPRKMNQVADFQANSSTQFAAIIQREQDLLDVLKGQVIQPVKGQKVVTKAGVKHTILELNGIKMEECEPKDIEEIKRRMGSNANRFVNAWKVSNEKQETAYRAYCKAEGLRMRDCKLLWHGTRSENVFSILKTGLVLRPTNAVITGKMLGFGLYMANDFMKSRNYTSARGTTWASGKDATGFMIMHAVAYGNPYDVYSFNQIPNTFEYKDLRKLKDANGNKYHCVHAHKGMDMGYASLRADEIVVYREDQIMPKYLVEIV